MVIIAPPRKPRDPSRPPFSAQVRYAIFFGVALFLIVGAALFVSERLY